MHADGSAFALRLAVDLKKKGFDVWIDREDIRAGQDWDIEIEKALVSCNYVLFLETEKSVVSKNVLDEVYFALEQNKKVIPLVYVDSKTPFRLNRLQHIDFTRDYDTGLALLENELEGTSSAVIYPAEENTQLPVVNKPFFKRSYLPLIILACLAMLATAAVLVNKKDKSRPSAGAEQAIVLTDTMTNQSGKLPGESKNQVINNDDRREDKKSTTKILQIENKRTAQGKKPSKGSIDLNPGFPISKGENTDADLSNLIETVTGDWKLIDVEPKARSQSGYLKIEAMSANKAAIKSYMQFYYPDSKASSYLTIFNAFAGCTSCVVTKEMKLNVEDIAVASRTIKKLEEDQPDGKKAGDIVLDANSNKSIRGSVMLKFENNNNAIIKVTQPLDIVLAYELKLQPFVYTFYFKKND